MKNPSSLPLLRHWKLALALAASASPALAGGIAVFEGPAGGIGSVRVYDELSGAPLNAPPELQGIQLLPIDFVGRTRLEELLPGRPRLRLDVGGASRLALSSQRGSLYHFARALAAGGTRFGYFRIAADGSVIVLFEQLGSGSLGAVDPFLGRVAVAPMSDELLLATTFDAGGNLIEISLAGGSAVDRTAALPPLHFQSASLWLTGSTGVASTDIGLLRFDRTQSGDASFVPFPSPAPAWFSGQVVASRNGQWFLTNAGADSANQLPYAFGTSGSAVAASQQPAAISVAGFEPEASDGPYMAIRDDGTQAAWRIEAGITREVLLAHVQPAPGEQPQELSGSANFLDTLDEIGLAIFRPGGDLHVAVGKSPLGVPNAMESFDTYAVTLPANPAPANFVNLSLFSGDATLPFMTAPQMKAREWVMLPDYATLLVHDDLPADGVLDAIRPNSGGAQPVLGFIKNLTALETAGRWLVAGIERSDQGHNVELYRMPLSLAQPAALLSSLGHGSSFSHFAARRDGWLAFVADDSATGATLQRAHLPSGTLQSWSSTPANFGAALGFTQFGSIALSLASPSSSATWPLGALPPVTLQSTSGPCQILPGL